MYSEYAGAPNCRPRASLPYLTFSFTPSICLSILVAFLRGVALQIGMRLLSPFSTRVLLKPSSITSPVGEPHEAWSPASCRLLIGSHVLSVAYTGCCGSRRITVVAPAAQVAGLTLEGEFMWVRPPDFLPEPSPPTATLVSPRLTRSALRYSCAFGLQAELEVYPRQSSDIALRCESGLPITYHKALGFLRKSTPSGVFPDDHNLYRRVCPYAIRIRFNLCRYTSLRVSFV